MDLGLKGKKAIVTGGTKGIGRAVADTLADEGCDVAICSRNAAEVEQAVADLKSKGVNACGQAVDILDGEAYKGWLSQAIGELGGVDIFIANVSAGGGGKGEDGWKANFEGDVMGTVRGVETVMPKMAEGGGGSVVIISTTAALEHFGSGVGPYNALKAALINYSAGIAQTGAPQNISCNVVSPGPIFIEGGAWNMIKDHMKDFYDATLAQIPAGRMGSGQDVANVVAFLASPAARYTTGANVVVDGGFTKRVQF